MNKQRKVLITTTYNEMGIIIDTKAEEVVQPDVPVTNVGDMVSRQAAIDLINVRLSQPCENHTSEFIKGMEDGQQDQKRHKMSAIRTATLDPVQRETARRKRKCSLHG